MAQCVTAFKSMLQARLLEEKLASLYRAGGRIVGGVYIGKGQEAFSAGLAVHLEKGKDVYGPLIRDQAGRLAFGEPLLDTFRTYLGVITGPMRGRDGNVHRGRPREGMPAMISHLGSLLSVVNGMLFARRLQGRLGDSVGATSLGEGGTSTGAFHEALNQAAIEKLPVIIAIANNQFSYSTPNPRQFACGDLLDRARGYGVQGYAVDGTDLTACVSVFSEAVKRARAGGGPQLVVGSLLRLSGHGEHDDSSYIPDQVKSSPLGQDCLPYAESQLKASDLITDEEVRKWKDEFLMEIDAALAQASKEPTPDPFRENWRALSTAGLVEGQFEA
jgi:pyruvate dehydrogenase E1 component alpha subunit/2-oxoisovalerate dehydrogenase E1 component alpha subunit